MKYFLPFSLALLFLASCQQDELAGWHPIDLQSHGLPVTILVPDSSAFSIKKSDMVVMEDINIKAGPGYALQIFAADATHSDAKKMLEESKKEVQNNPLFSRFVEEYEDGFLFENRIDPSTVSYDFRKVLLKNGKEYTFRTSMLGIFSEEDAKKMYKSVLVDK